MNLHVVVKRVAVLIAIGLVATLLSGTGATAQASSGMSTPVAETWRTMELTFHAREQHENPYLDVEMDAVFRGPDRRVLQVPAFWDGGDIWRVRFAPTKPGLWTWTTTSSVADAGLSGRAGRFVAERYKGDNSLYRHGFVVPSSDDRHLEHADGTPFFWLGDTHWFGLSSREALASSTSSKYPGSQFRQTVDKRAAEGYNVYQSNLFVGEWGDVSPTGTANEGGHPWAGTGLRNYVNHEVGGTYSVHGGNASSTKGEYFEPYHWRRAVDGNPRTAWEAAAKSFPQWIVLDLNQPEDVAKVSLRFGSEATWRYRIEAATTRDDFTTLVDRTGAGRQGGTVTETLDTDKEYRFLRVVITGNDTGAPASLAEFDPTSSGGRELWNSGLFKRLNPAFWQDVDQRINYLSDHEMVTALGLDWARFMPDDANLEDYQRVARYVVARYASSPVVWLTAGEWAQGDEAGWAKVAKTLHDLDPYHRATTVHNEYDNGIRYRDQSWLGYVALQGGHGAVRPNSFYEQQYAATPTKPVLESESNYELSTPTLARETAWKSTLLTGFVGFGYGAEGGWQSTHDENDQWQLFFGGAPTPWFEALDKPGGKQVGYLGSFVRSLPFRTLAPAPFAIYWQGAPTSGSGEPAMAADEMRSTIVAHLPQHGSTYTGRLVGLDPEVVYQATWFDPTTGRRTAIASRILGSTTWSVPAQPSAEHDWVLLVRTKNGTPAEGGQPAPEYAEAGKWNDDHLVSASYTQEWTYENKNLPQYYLGDAHYSNTSGSSATFTFTGTGLSLIGAKNPSHGRADVRVCDAKGEACGAPVVMDTYAPVNAYQQMIWSVDGLDPGTHSVKVAIRNDTGGSDRYTDIDAFVVR